MVEAPEMAEFVHDDVVGKMLGKKRYTIIEIQIPLLRTTSPKD